MHRAFSGNGRTAWTNQDDGPRIPPHIVELALGLSHSLSFFTSCPLLHVGRRFVLCLDGQGNESVVWLPANKEQGEEDGRLSLVARPLTPTPQRLMRNEEKPKRKADTKDRRPAEEGMLRSYYMFGKGIV